MFIDVLSTVHIEMKQEAFTEEFFAGFCETIQPLLSVEQHAEWIATLIVRGDLEEINEEGGGDQFVEGYGTIGNFVKLAKFILRPRAV